MTRVTASDLRDAISVEGVIARYGLRARRRGTQYRLKECPRCRHVSSREAVAIDVKSGSWLHHGAERQAGGQCSGDVLDLIAACEGLDCKRDFRKIVDVAAEISGLATESAFERDLRVTAAKERARQDVVAELERRLSNRSTAAARWDALATDDERGRAYLASRGLCPSEAARFDRDGVVVAIRDADGCPISTATRRYEGEPKVMALRDHSTRGTFVDALRDIRHDRAVYICEGLMDSLTAREAWSDATILGANGAGNIAKIMASAIPRLRLASARVVLVPHDDERGIAACTEAAKIAVAANIELGGQLDILELPSKDLNDAWCAGWRP